MRFILTIIFACISCVPASLVLAANRPVHLAKKTSTVPAARHARTHHERKGEDLSIHPLVGSGDY